MNLLDILTKLLEKANQNPDKVAEIIQYLTYFNYIAQGKDLSIDEVLSAIKKLQDQYGIKEVGIGPKTIRAMDWPRCGVKEHLTENATGVTPKWGISDLAYFIRNRDTDLSPATWDSIFRKAFDSITVVCSLKFHQVQTEREANIVWDIGSSRADDFDGPSGVLAWMQLCPSPGFTGQVLGKLDTAETWVEDASKRGIIMQNVVAHESIHALGFVHSTVSTALMAPFYSPSIQVPQLNDDIPRLQKVYGPPVVTPPTPPTPPVPPQPPIPPTAGSTVITINGAVNSISIPGYRVTKMG